MSESTFAQDAPVAPVEAIGFKVFIGNLAFATTEEDIKQFFSPVGEV